MRARMRVAVTKLRTRRSRGWQRGEIRLSRGMRWSLVLAVVACTPNTAAPVAEEPPPVALAEPSQAELGLVGNSYGYGLLSMSDEQLKLVTDIQEQLKPCGDETAEQPTMWQAVYKIPGHEEPWRRWVVFGGAKTRRCMEGELAMIKWPEGWSAEVRDAASFPEPAPDPIYVPTHAYLDRLRACSEAQGPGRVELDSEVTDASGSTVTTGFTSGTLAAERCFLQALREYRTLPGWTATFTLRRGPVTP